jgi:hypothetical protein
MSCPYCGNRHEPEFCNAPARGFKIKLHIGSWLSTPARQRARGRKRAADATRGRPRARRRGEWRAPKEAS